METNPTARPSTAKDAVFPGLLHLLHPYLLKNMSTLVQHMSLLKKQLEASAAGTTNASLAKKGYLELVTSLGVDLETLLNVLASLLEDASHLDGQHLGYHCLKADVPSQTATCAVLSFYASQLQNFTKLR